jgi:RNA-directed DNA polymerase
MQVSFESIYSAHIRCRKRKRSTVNTQRFEIGLIDHLFHLQLALQHRTWSPARSVRFVVSQPKAREIYAADYSDRVVHHWLVPQLETLFEPVFIYDCWSNRKGKGTHGAVERLQNAMRSQTQCGDTTGWFMQLDIKNFFNSIHKPTLFALVQHRLRKAIQEKKVSRTDAERLRWLVHVLLKADPVQHAIAKGSLKSFESVPPHKRLGATGPEFGLPIGNLTSQFLANVYMNELDQFIKHELKCRHYVRYVDDFILLAESPGQLDSWHLQIAIFLRDKLQLVLKAGSVIKPIAEGANFLGYIVRPTHLLVRARVKQHLDDRLQAFEKRFIGHQRRGTGLMRVLKADETHIAKLCSQVASYMGHYKHANCHHLLEHTHRRYEWLRALKHARLRQPRYRDQVQAARRQFPSAVTRFEKGHQTDVYKPLLKPDAQTGCNDLDVLEIFYKQGGYLASGRRARHLTSFTWSKQQ